MMTGYLGELSL